MPFRGHIYCSSRSSALPRFFLLALCLCLTILPLAHAQDVLTYHNDNARTGQNLNETILTTANVNSTTFGRLFTLSVDGKVDAQPLYLSAGNGTHNVLFVATEHDSVYAFDADTGVPIWQVSLLPSGETTAVVGNCSQVNPVIGITATPVIDRTRGPNGTIYAVAMSQDAAKNYHQRLHALDVSTGQEEFSGPVEIVATFPSTGPNSHNGMVVFDPSKYKERAALLLVNHVIYTTWASHCDHSPYNGWIIGYDEASLAQVNVLNVTPNGTDGAFWSSGGGPAADANGNIYLLDGNGTFDTTLDSNGFPIKGDYGNGFLKLSASSTSLTVADYFNMSNTSQESGADTDLGSGAALLLPDLTDSSGVTKHLAIGAGKDANIYLVDRDTMGKFNPNSNLIYQPILGVLPGGVWSVPAYFNNIIYYGPTGHAILAFQLSNAQLLANPVSQTSHSFGSPGASPSISANQNSNAILWAAENGSTAVLHAYDATNLSHELYNSNQAPSGRDHFGTGNKFITPTIANGKVYVGTTNSVGVFGLLPPATTTSLSSSLNPAAAGQTVTFTATVSSTTGIATGSVTFNDGTSAIGMAVLDGTATAIFATSTLIPGSHSITAVYGGDTNHGASTSTVLNQMVIGQGATLALSSSANPSNYGQSVTFTATVTSLSGPVPTGSVTFKSTSKTLGTITLDGSGSARVTPSPTALAGGPHKMSATYSGDTNYTGSTASITQTVKKVGVVTTVASSANPSAHGASVTFTATVSWSGPQNKLTGTVDFEDGGKVFGTTSLNSAGVATFKTSALAVGTHSITAHYRGSASFFASDSTVLLQTVN